MKPDLLFFDVDGTIYEAGTKSVRREIVEAIRKARSLGHRCYLSTGRPYSQIPENIRSIGFDGMILSHGAHIRENEKDTFVDYMDSEKLRELCKVLDQNDIEYALFDTEDTYLDSYEKFLYPFYMKGNMNEDHFIITDDRQNVIDRCVKMEFYAPTDEMLALVREAASDFKIYGGYSSRRYDLYDKDKNKGDAVRKLLSEHKSSFSESYAFGDSRNDTEMLAVVDHPIIMGNADEDFKKDYSDFCPGVEEDGVAVRLKVMYDFN